MNSIDVSDFERSGDFYSTPQAGNNAPGSPTNLHLMAIPFIVKKTTTYNQISVQVTTAGNDNYRLGIYSDIGGASPVYPGSLLLDAGTINAGSTGIKSIVINQTLSPGLYWLVTATFLVSSKLTVISNPVSILGFTGDFFNGLVNQCVGYDVSGTDYTGGLPDPYPSGASFIFNFGFPLPPMIALTKA